MVIFASSIEEFAVIVEQVYASIVKSETVQERGMAVGVVLDLDAKQPFPIWLVWELSLLGWEYVEGHDLVQLLAIELLSGVQILVDTLEPSQEVCDGEDCASRRAALLDFVGSRVDILYVGVELHITLCDQVIEACYEGSDGTLVVCDFVSPIFESPHGNGSLDEALLVLGIIRLEASNENEVGIFRDYDSSCYHLHHRQG